MVRKILYGIEKGDRNYAAYSPDYPGCVATGRTVQETRNNMASALAAHIGLMLSSGDELPDEDVEGGFLLVEIAERQPRVIDGAALREYRLRHHLSKAALAARLEVSAATVTEWEHGRQPLPGTLKFALAAIG